MTCSIGFATVSFASFEGRYCEMDGAYTESGESSYKETQKKREKI